MFSGRKKREMRVAREAAEKAIIQERFEAQVAEQRRLIEAKKQQKSTKVASFQQRVLTSEQKAAGNRASIGCLGVIFATIIAIAVGQFFSLLPFILIALIATGIFVAISRRKKIRGWLIGTLTVATVAMFFSVLQADGRRHSEEIVRQQELHEGIRLAKVAAEKKANHERRLAWQKAHPSEYAALETKLRGAQINTEKQHIAAERAALAAAAANSKLQADNVKKRQLLFEASLELENNVFGHPIQNWRWSNEAADPDRYLVLEIDEDIWDTMSSQDHDLLQNHLREAMDGDGPNSHVILLHNLAGNQL